MQNYQCRVKSYTLYSSTPTETLIILHITKRVVKGFFVSRELPIFVVVK